MFYCEECARKHGFPQAPAMNLEPCEMCGHTKVCYNNPEQAEPELRLTLPHDPFVVDGCRLFAKRLLGFGFSDGDRRLLASKMASFVEERLADERIACAAIAEQVGEQRSPKVAANMIRGRSK